MKLSLEISGLPKLPNPFTALRKLMSKPAPQQLQPTRIPVESEALKTVLYRADTCELELEFHTKRIYRYFAVPQKTYEDLMRAPSMGTFFVKNIRNEYTCIEL